MKPEPTELGARIKEARKKANLSQIELAKLLGKTLRTVQKYESGEIEPPLSVVRDIAWKLNTSAAYLIGFDKNNIRLDTMADVCAFFYQLNEKKDLQFEIEERIPSLDGERSCIIRFDARNLEAGENYVLYNFLREFEIHRHMMETYWISHDALEKWADEYCGRLADRPLRDKTYEELDEVTRFQRRLELDRQMMEAIKKAAEKKDDQ